MTASTGFSLEQRASSAFKKLRVPVPTTSLKWKKIVKQFAKVCPVFYCLLFCNNPNLFCYYKLQISSCCWSRNFFFPCNIVKRFFATTKFFNIYQISNEIHDLQDFDVSIFHTVHSSHQCCLAKMNGPNYLPILNLLC